MSKSKPFNGFRNWNHWNVSLWINNDEGLYRMAKQCIRTVKEDKPKHGTKEMAACLMLNELADLSYTKTPDGAPYSVSSIPAAMVGM